MAAAPANHRGLLFLILKFLDEHNLPETARALEQETGIFFNVGYFEESFVSGAYQNAEIYLRSFTKATDSLLSSKIFFELRKYKFLDALKNGNGKKAREILYNEILIFDQCSGDFLVEASEILDNDDHAKVQEFVDEYGGEDLPAARREAMYEMRRCIELNPALIGKLYRPTFRSCLQNLVVHALGYPSNGYFPMGPPPPPPPPFF